MSDSSPNFLQPVRVVFYDPFQTPEKHEHTSLTRPSWFTGPYVTSVGGTIKARPEIAANISGGGFSTYFLREVEQYAAVTLYFGLPGYLELYNGLFECVRCRDLAFSYFVVICAATGLAAPPPNISRD